MGRFDEIFRKQVTEVFSHYNADHLADEGWNAFVNTHLNKRRKVFLFPLWAKAASVAVIIGLASLLTYRLVTISDSAELTVISEEPGVVDPAFSGEPETIIAGTTESKTTVVLPAIIDHDSVPKPVRTKEDEIFAANVPESDPAFQRQLLPLPRATLTGFFKTGPSLIQFDPDNLRLNSIASNEPVSLLTEDETVKAVARTSLMAGISGMMAHVDDALANSPGVALGFYIDKKIFNGVSVRPGLAIGKYSSGLENMNVSSVLGFAAPTSGNVTGSVEAYSARVDMITMEIPVNIVVSLWERGKSSIYLATGVSTVIYLDQSYSGSASNLYAMTSIDESTGNQVYESTLSKMSFESEYGAFSHVDYFGLANFSAGYSLPVGNNNFLLIEPYIQLPVSDLTSRNVRIRYGGMSFKMSFGK
jgi:hypothetical protein